MTILWPTVALAILLVARVRAQTTESSTSALSLVSATSSGAVSTYTVSVGAVRIITPIPLQQNVVADVFRMLQIPNTFSPNNFNASVGDIIGKESNG
jgi:hypothetical protein